MECSGNIDILNTNFTSNSLIQNYSNDAVGSTLYLDNPGNITIFSCLFFNNTGILGSSIYYSETSNPAKIYWNNNLLNLIYLKGEGFISNITTKWIF